MSTLWDYLPLPKAFDKEQMWEAIRMMNQNSFSMTDEMQRILYKAWRTSQEAGMTDLKSAQQVTANLPDELESLPLAELSLALIVSEKV